MSKNNIISGAPDRSVPAHLNFGRFLLDNLAAGGGKIALIDAESGKQYSYRQLLQWSVNAAASFKRMGVGKGDVVGVCSENRVEYAITIMGVIYCGATLAVVSATYTQGEIIHALNMSKPKLIFSSRKVLEKHYDTIKKLNFIERIIKYGENPFGTIEDFNDLIKNEVDIESFEPEDVKGQTDTMVILCSSGTTGMPKGVMLTHLNCMLSAINWGDQNLDKRGIFNVLLFTPWHHAYGFLCILNYLNAGRTIVFLHFKESTFFEEIQNRKVNLVCVVPTVAYIMSKSSLMREYDMSSLRYLYCGGAVLMLDTIHALKTILPSLISVTQGYGMTETALAVLHDEHYDGSSAGSVGTVVRGHRVKVVDLETGKNLGPSESGEICVKGGLIMKGYIGDEKATAAIYDEDGFLKTGDVGYYTEDFVFYIVDRVKDIIKFKGYQVAPAEVEEVLLQHPGVKECGVVGTPDGLAGELPTAFVIKVSGSPVTEGDLVDLVALKLSNPKKLRGGVRFVDELPKNSTGKIQRRVLRALCAGL